MVFQYNTYKFYWPFNEIYIGLIGFSNSYTHSPSDVKVNGELENRDNSTSHHIVVVDPDQLIGPQVIDMIMNKPGMIRWFKLC